MTKHPQDIFDVYGEYPHIHPVSVEEAIQKFRHYFTEVIPAAGVALTASLRKGESTTETRKATGALLEQQRVEVEILLFRSIMGGGMTDTNQNNESWVHRVLDERSELEKKIDALRLFLGSCKADALPNRVQADLREQLYHMEGYAWVLQRRLRTAGLQTNKQTTK